MEPHGHDTVLLRLGKLRDNAVDGTALEEPLRWLREVAQEDAVCEGQRLLNSEGNLCSQGGREQVGIDVVQRVGVADLKYKIHGKCLMCCGAMTGVGKKKGKTHTNRDEQNGVGAYASVYICFRVSQFFFSQAARKPSFRTSRLAQERASYIICGLENTAFVLCSVFCVLATLLFTFQAEHNLSVTSILPSVMYMCTYVYM